MPTINYRVNKIEGVRTGDEANSVEIKSNFAILSVKQEKNPSIGDILDVAFRFEVDYEPSLGKMKVEGSLWYADKDLDKLVSEKDGKVKLEPELVKAVTTSIVRESLLEVIDLSKKLRLPVPIKLPSVEMKPTKLEFKKTSKTA
jgi:hypothetical protein